MYRTNEAIVWFVWPLDRTPVQTVAVTCGQCTPEEADNEEEAAL